MTRLRTVPPLPRPLARAGREHRAGEHEREADRHAGGELLVEHHTPRTAATAGLTYVITVARTGPISAISLKKRMNASAVQMTASVTTEATTSKDGNVDGRENAANGA